MTDNGDQSFIRVKYGGKYPNTDHLERAVRLGKGGGGNKEGSINGYRHISDKARIFLINNKV